MWEILILKRVGRELNVKIQRKRQSSPDLDFIPKMFQSQGVIGGGLLGGVFHPVHGATSAQESFSDLWAQTPQFYVHI